MLVAEYETLVVPQVFVRIVVHDDAWIHHSVNVVLHVLPAGNRVRSLVHKRIFIREIRRVRRQHRVDVERAIPRVLVPFTTVAAHACAGQPLHDLVAGRVRPALHGQCQRAGHDRAREGRPPPLASLLGHARAGERAREGRRRQWPSPVLVVGGTTVGLDRAHADDATPGGQPIRRVAGRVVPHAGDNRNLRRNRSGQSPAHALVITGIARRRRDHVDAVVKRVLDEKREVGVPSPPLSERAVGTRRLTGE